jgi:hypothetical protein
VKLRASGPGGDDVHSLTNLISVSTSPPPPTAPVAILRVDFNGDRKSDIAWVGKAASDHRHRLHYRRSGGGAAIVRGLTPPSISALLLGDFDGNKITDYAFAAKVGSRYDLRVRWNSTGRHHRLGSGPSNGDVTRWRTG